LQDILSPSWWETSKTNCAIGYSPVTPIGGKSRREKNILELVITPTKRTKIPDQEMTLTGRKCIVLFITDIAWSWISTEAW